MPSDRAPRAAKYRVYGMSQSYFTRKLTGYLDYKAIPYLLRRFVGGNRAARDAGWPGAMPVVMTPGGEFMWDTTAMIHHLESRFPEPRVFPVNPVLRFVDYVLEDALDEWFYRAAVGSRWFYEENHRVGGWELARTPPMRWRFPRSGLRGRQSACDRDVRALWRDGCEHRFMDR